MRLSFVLLAGLAALGSTQSTAQFFLGSFYDEEMVGSVIASGASATTYFITCATSSSTTSSSIATESASHSDYSDDDDTCGLVGGLTITQGPSTVEYVYSVSTELYLSMNCALAGTTSASCTLFQSVYLDYTSGSTTTSLATALTGTDMVDAFTAISITTAVLAASATANAVTATSTGTGVAAAKSTGLSASGTTSGSAVVASGTAGSPSTSTSAGGMPRITGNAGWIVGGVALGVVAVL